MNPIRYIIVDDHPVFRRGLRLLTNSDPNLELLGEADNGLSALEMARQLKPDIILMDIHMPQMNGIDATRLITQELPEIGIIILTMMRDDEYVFSAIQAGARGYMLKDTEEEPLLQAIHAVARGEGLVDSHIAGRVLDEFRRMNTIPTKNPDLQQLSEPESTILRLVAQGHDNTYIANQLSISEKTVVNRLSVIYQKLHINNRTQAALFALRQGLASLSPDP